MWRIGRLCLRRGGGSTEASFNLRGGHPSFRPLQSAPSRYQSTAGSANDDNSSEAKNIDVALYVWGTNQKGSLPGAAASDTVYDVPHKVDWRGLLRVSDPAITLKQVVCGASDTALLLSDGRCFVSGLNKEGQLGLGHKDSVETPTLLDPGFEIASIDLGQSSAALTDKDGELYTCGYGGAVLSSNGIGQLGQGDGNAYLTPKLVESLVEDGVTTKEVAVGESHMTVLTDVGEVLCCGACSYGRLGNLSTTDQLYLEPVELLTHDVIQLAGGKSFSLAMTKDGVVHGWGRNHKGQLGVGLGLAVDMYAMEQVPSPIESEELVGRSIAEIRAGNSHAAAISTSGELFIWGMSLHLEPVPVPELLGTKVVDASLGLDYTLILDEDGKLYSLGNGGKWGVLGQASTTKNLNQARVLEALADKGKVQAINAGWRHAACLVEET